MELGVGGRTEYKGAQTEFGRILEIFCLTVVIPLSE